MPEEAVLTPTAPSAGAGGGEGTSSIVESPTTVEETQSTTTDAGTENAPATESTETPQTTPGQQDAGEDGRVIPKYIRDMQKSNPDGYAKAKADFFALRAFRSVFPSSAEAAKAKEELEMVGGPEGLADMQTDYSEIKSVAQQFFDGDPAFVDDLANEDPIAFGAHVPHTLDKFQEVDKAGYNREIARRISTEHQAVGLRGRLEAAYQAIKDGKSEEAQGILNAIASWHDRLEEIGNQQEDPRFAELRERLKNERVESQQRTKEEVHGNYIATASQQIQSRASSLLDSYLAGRRMEAADKQRLLRHVIRDANDEVVADGQFQKQLNLQKERAYSTRDASAAVRFAVARFEQALKRAVEQQSRLLGAPRVSAGPQRTNGTAAPAQRGKAVDGFQYTAQAPSDREIDRFATNRDMILKQRAVLKDGRKVTWAKE